MRLLLREADVAASRAPVARVAFYCGESLGLSTDLDKQINKQLDRACFKCVSVCAFVRRCVCACDGVRESFLDNAGDTA